MKIVTRILILVTILCLSQVSMKKSHRRGRMHYHVNKKSTSLTNGGNGSWDTGLLCPKIRVEKDGHENVYENVLLRPKQLETPQTLLEQSGIILTFSTAPSGSLLEILKPVPNQANTFILHFKKFRFNFELSDIGGFFTGKHYGILGDIIHEGTKCSLKITLPYESGSAFRYITYEQMLKLTQLIQQKRSDYAVLIREKVRLSQEALQDYLRYKSLLDDTGSKGANHGHLHKALEQKKSELKKSLEDDVKTLAELQELKRSKDQLALERYDKGLDLQQEAKNLLDDIFVTKQLVGENEEKNEAYVNIDQAIKNSLEDHYDYLQQAIESTINLAAMSQSNIDKCHCMLIKNKSSKKSVMTYWDHPEILDPNFEKAIAKLPEV
jgi:hypothetical protein